MHFGPTGMTTNVRLRVGADDLPNDVGCKQIKADML